jgi:hypothetical protein
LIYADLEINLYKNGALDSWNKMPGKNVLSDNRKKKGNGEGLPLIECFCGAKILLVPNVKLMSEAIETHVQEHIKNLKAPKKDVEAEAERIRDDLIAKVLSKACEQ